MKRLVFEKKHFIGRVTTNKSGAMRDVFAKSNLEELYQDALPGNPLTAYDAIRLWKEKGIHFEIDHEVVLGKLNSAGIEIPEKNLSEKLRLSLTPILP